MHTNPVINILNQISRKASKVLLRDYFELENIQSSPKGPYLYAAKSIDIVQDILIKELAKAHPDYSIVSSDNNYLHKAQSEYRFVINPLDAFHNLARCNPFFAFAITLEKEGKDKFDAVSCLINSAQFGLTYYATKGQGAWVEKIERGVSNAYRIRVSANNAPKEALFGLNASDDYSVRQMLLNRIEDIDGRVRIFGSELMTGAMVASGKLDAAIFHKPSYNNMAALKLLISEAGGITFNIKQGIEDALICCSAAQYKELFKHFNGQ
jgi:myo-inositol-1(or 4)-monophosphatase